MAQRIERVSHMIDRQSYARAYGGNRCTSVPVRTAQRSEMYVDVQRQELNWVNHDEPGLIDLCVMHAVRRLGFCVDRPNGRHRIGCQLYGASSMEVYRICCNFYDQSASQTGRNICSHEISLDQSVWWSHIATDVRQRALPTLTARCSRSILLLRVFYTRHCGSCGGSEIAPEFLASSMRPYR